MSLIYLLSQFFYNKHEINKKFLFILNILKGENRTAKNVMRLLLMMNIFIVNDLIKNKEINDISLPISQPIVTKVNEVTSQDPITAFYNTPYTSFNNKANNIQTHTSNIEKYDDSWLQFVRN